MRYISCLFVILSLCITILTGIFCLRVKDFSALYNALSSCSFVYVMSSFAVSMFLFWKSSIACSPIFVYFPLVGISRLSSVSPLYSILIGFLCG